MLLRHCFIVIEAAEARHSSLVAEGDGDSATSILVNVGKTSSDTLNRWISSGASNKLH